MQSCVISGFGIQLEFLEVYYVINFKKDSIGTNKDRVLSYCSHILSFYLKCAKCIQQWLLSEVLHDLFAYLIS